VESLAFLYNFADQVQANVPDIEQHSPKYYVVPVREFLFSFAFALLSYAVLLAGRVLVRRATVILSARGEV
jgi:hypothetical protein